MVNNSLFVKDHDQYLKVEFDEILWVQQIDDQSEIHTEKRKYSINYPLNDLIDKLPSERFIRIHEQYSVNTSYLDSIDLLNGKVFLSNNKLPLGATYKSEVIKRLNCIGIID